ncbi:MAG: precorrin-8X methylmutase [Desulfuromonas sp.]|nr:MAG: precorrin-8X methylmutase [Desulfuromonas sp.]
MRDPLGIERESFRIIDAEAGEHGFSMQEWPLVRRVVHTSADFEFIANTVFSAGVIASGMASLKQGCTIYCDTNMIVAGVNKQRLAELGCTLRCYVADPEVAREARERGVTRSIVGLEKGVAEGCRIFLIGNAPTALYALLELHATGKVDPALVVGCPVGFVGAAESKEELAKSELPFIVCRGRKGGSTIAVALLNALMIETLEG